MYSVTTQVMTTATVTTATSKVVALVLRTTAAPLSAKGVVVDVHLVATVKLDVVADNQVLCEGCCKLGRDGSYCLGRGCGWRPMDEV